MVDDVLNKYGALIVAELRDEIKNKPLPRRNGSSYVANASGKLEKGLKYTVEDGVLKVWADSYIYYLVFGRGPTKVTSGTGIVRKRIREWIDAKGITPDGITKDSLAFLIARKIHREGTLLYPAGSDLISSIVTQKLIDDIKSDLFSTFADVVKTSLDQLKKAA